MLNNLDGVMKSGKGRKPPRNYSLCGKSSLALFVGGFLIQCRRYQITITTEPDHSAGRNENTHNVQYTSRRHHFYQKSSRLPQDVVRQFHSARSASNVVLRYLKYNFFQNRQKLRPEFVLRFKTHIVQKSPKLPPDLMRQSQRLHISEKSGTPTQILK